MLTSQEFADAIGVCLVTTYNWEKKGIIKPARVTPSGRRYYTQEQVDAYLAGDYDNPVLKGQATNGVFELKGGDVRYGS